MSYLYLRGIGKKKEIWIGFPASTGIKRRRLGIAVETVTMRNGKVLYPARAKELQQAIDAEIAKGTFNIHTQRKVPVLSVMIKEFVRVRSGKIGSAQTYEYRKAAEKVITAIGDLPVGNYTTLALGYFQSDELKHSKINTVAKLFRNLHAVFAYAAREFRIDNPIVSDLILKQEVRTPRVYSTEELSSFLGKALELNPALYDQAVFLLLTGMRVSESCTVQFDQIDLKRDCIQYRNMKGKREEVFPIDAALKAFLTTLPKSYAPYVFQYRNRFRMADAFDQVAAAANLPAGLSLHNLKKTFSTLLADTGSPIEITQELSRHVDIKTTLAFYVFKRLESKRTALSNSREPIQHLLEKKPKLRIV